MSLRRLRWQHFVIACVLPLVVTFLKDLIGLDSTAPFLLYLLAILATAWVGGFWAGAISTLVSLAATFYFLFPVENDSELWNRQNILHSSVFLIEGFAISALCANFHKRWRRATAAPATTVNSPNRAPKPAHQFGRMRDTEEFSQRLLEAVNEHAVFMLDPHGKISSWSVAAEHVTGWKTQQLLGQHVSILQPPLGSVDPAGRSARHLSEIKEKPEDRSNEQLRLAREQGRVEIEEIRLKSDGAPFWAALIISPLRDDQDELRGYVNVISDVSVRKKMELDLLEQAEQWKIMIEAVKDYSICRLDPHGRVVTWSKEAERVQGWRTASVTGQSLDVFYTREDRAQGLPQIELQQAAFAGDYTTECWRVREDGKRYWADIVCSPLHGINGELIGFVEVLRDITERRELAEEKEHFLQIERMARAAAEQASRQKDEFLAMLSHELRTPLTMILGWTQMLLSNEFDDEQRSEGLRIVDRHARIQSNLVNDMLDMGRIITGKLKVEIEPVNVGQVVKAGVQAMALAAKAKDITVVSHIDMHACYVGGDPNRLGQVIWNLLSNAIKFTGRHGRVEVSVSRSHSDIIIKVSDDGLGIDAEFLPFVFDKFSQQETGRGRKFGGLGLGLSIVRYLVEMHGGEIRAHSEGLGHGASFIVKIPLLAMSGQGPLATGSSSSTITTSSGNIHQLEAKIGHMENAHLALVDPAQPNRMQLAGLRVLVIDDDLDTRNMLKATLEHSGALVSTVAGGVLALDKMGDFRPDVVICDIGMPDMSGHDFIRRLRSFVGVEWSHVPAIALTAYSHEADRVNALAAGFQRHISKPVLPQLLAQAVLEVSNPHGGQPTAA